MSGHINYIRRVSKLQAPFQIPNPVIRPQRPTPDPNLHKRGKRHSKTKKKKKDSSLYNVRVTAWEGKKKTPKSLSDCPESRGGQKFTHDDEQPSLLWP